MSDTGNPVERTALRVFMSQGDVHYAGGLVAGARILELFGDAGTDLLLARDGVEGLLACYEDIQFKRPVFAGDTLDVEARLLSMGRTSRRIRFQAAVGGAVVCTAEAVVIAKPPPCACARGPTPFSENDDGAVRA